MQKRRVTGDDLISCGCVCLALFFAGIQPDFQKGSFFLLLAIWFKIRRGEL